MRKQNDGEEGVRKIATFRLERIDRRWPDEPVAVDIRMDFKSGEFQAEYATKKFHSMNLPEIRDAIKTHDYNLGKFTWEPKILIENDEHAWSSTPVLGINYWRLFRGELPKTRKKKLGADSVWRAWIGDNYRSDDEEAGLDRLEIGEPGPWVSIGNDRSRADVTLDYAPETWEGLRTLSKLEGELKGRLKKIIDKKPGEITAFLLAAAKRDIGLLIEGRK